MFCYLFNKGTIQFLLYFSPFTPKTIEIPISPYYILLLCICDKVEKQLEKTCRHFTAPLLTMIFRYNLLTFPGALSYYWCQVFGYS